MRGPGHRRFVRALDAHKAHGLWLRHRLLKWEKKTPFAARYINYNIVFGVSRRYSHRFWNAFFVSFFIWPRRMVVKESALLIRRQEQYGRQVELPLLFCRFFFSFHYILFFVQRECHFWLSFGRSTQQTASGSYKNEYDPSSSSSPYKNFQYVFFSLLSFDRPPI